jgi:prepilin-type N-terminal cleavage/methylation domain-containing protein
MKEKGFTLLEILLVIAAIGILAAIVIVAINPNRQLAQVRDTSRKSDAVTLQKALEQYLIDTGTYPSGVTNEYTEVCNSGSNSIGEGSVNSGCVDLRPLVPSYIASIPTDPSGGAGETGFYVHMHSVNQKITITSSQAENTRISINPDYVQDSLVLNLDAGNDTSYSGTGSTWADLSDNGVNGTLQGSVDFQTNPEAFNFNPNEYVSFANDADLRFTGNSEYTLEAWFNPDANPGPNNWTGIFNRESNLGSGRDGYNIYLNGSSGSSMRIATERFASGTQYVARIDLNQSQLIDQWHHVVAVYGQDQVLRLYLNGEEVDSEMSPGSLTNTSTSLTLARREVNYFIGRIAIARIYSRGLTPEEVQQNYTTLKSRF